MSGFLLRLVTAEINYYLGEDYIARALQRKNSIKLTTTTTGQTQTQLVLVVVKPQYSRPKPICPFMTEITLETRMLVTRRNVIFQFRPNTNVWCLKNSEQSAEH